MNYTDLVPSRELCEVMSRLGICQSEPRLFFVAPLGSDDWSVRDTKSKHYEYEIIAPLLSDMMEALPEWTEITKAPGKKYLVVLRKVLDLKFSSASLADAVAQALIAIAKEQP